MSFFKKNSFHYFFVNLTTSLAIITSSLVGMTRALIFDLSVELGGSPEHINKDSLNSVKNYLLKPKSNLFVSGKVKQSRVHVLKGGLVILTALFKRLKIKKLFEKDYLHLRYKTKQICYDDYS